MAKMSLFSEQTFTESQYTIQRKLWLWKGFLERKCGVRVNVHSSVPGTGKAGQRDRSCDDGKHNLLMKHNQLSTSAKTRWISGTCSD